MNHELPSLKHQLQNFFSFVRRVCIAKLKGEVITVSSIERKRRLQMCGIETPNFIGYSKKTIINHCDFLNESGTRCNACGCNLYFKSKYRQEQCPINKW